MCEVRGARCLPYFAPRTSHLARERSEHNERNEHNEHNMSNHTLVLVFLRGGADGLSLVAPTADDLYHRARPTLAVKRGSGHKLDDRFELHPLLAPLGRWFDDGKLAVTPA